MINSNVTVASDVAFFSCPATGSAGWIPRRDLALPIDDWGFRQGVTLVERLRTYGGRPFQMSRYWARFEATAADLSINGLPDATQLAVLVGELIGRNPLFFREHGDAGITLWATPGAISGAAAGRPTWAMHLNPLDHVRIAKHRREGQPLVVTRVRQPSSDCWPRHWKVRSRLHYHLADAEAHRSHADATGVLLDEDGSVTESSVANVMIIVKGVVIAPPSDRVLRGVTMGCVREHAIAAGIAWVERPIRPEDLLTADEVMLTGTDTGVWFANRVNHVPRPSHRGISITETLSHHFLAAAQAASGV